MTPEERAHLEERRQAVLERLRVLELQEEQFGAYTPAHIMVEIKKARQRVAEIDQQLAGQRLPGESPANTHIGDIVYGDKIIGDKVGRDKITYGRPDDQKLPEENTRPFELTTAEMVRLADLLLRTSTMRNESMRSTIIDELPSRMSSLIVRDREPRTEVLNMVRVARRFAGGIDALLEKLRDLEGEDSLAMRDADAYLRQLKEKYAG